MLVTGADLVGRTLKRLGVDTFFFLMGRADVASRKSLYRSWHPRNRCQARTGGGDDGACLCATEECAGRLHGLLRTGCTEPGNRSSRMPWWIAHLSLRSADPAP